MFNFKKYAPEIVVLMFGVILSIIIATQTSVSSNNIFNEVQKQELVEVLKTIDISEDLIRGKPIPNHFYILEYIDLQCPFCQKFHTEIKQYIDKTPYVLDGDVSWVIRHGPHIDEISTKKAEFVECVKDIEGPFATWDFIDGAVLVTEELEFPNQRFEVLTDDLGLDTKKIFSCLNRRIKKDEVQKIRTHTNALNITQTPFLQFITPDGELLNEYSGVLRTEDLIEFTEEYINQQN